MSHPLLYKPLDKKLPQDEPGVKQMRDDLDALQKALEGAVEATARFLSARRELQAAWPRLQDLDENAPFSLAANPSHLEAANTALAEQ